MMESLVLLAVAVIVFRGFAVEGYMISTGSMAPTLLGYHHQITCPECSFAFARGTRAEDAVEHVETAWAGYDLAQPMLSLSRCPNCGFNGIQAEDLPRTEGDQLLVHKHAYDFRSPHRWEVIVFRNPGDPRQAYVKRVAGLPGETIELVRGDVLINGKLTRKPYTVQRAVRIPVSAYASQIVSDDPDGQPSWVKLQRDSTWTLEENLLRCNSANASQGKSICWVGHRHWIRSGGTHITQVKLARWPAGLNPLDASAEPLRYAGGTLQMTGVLTDIERRTWLARSDDPEFQRAVNELAEQSHIAPITDEYGYNSSDSLESHPVNEFLVSLTLADVKGPGRFEIELSNGEHIFSAVFKFGHRSVELLRDGDPVPVRTATLNEEITNKPLQIDFSLIDQQVVLALNGQELLEPYPYEGASTSPLMRRPVRFGAAELDCVVTELGLFRDIYYTPKATGEQTQYVVGKDEFFVLGDNSPVSVDSRVWEDPAVPRAALIGKPLVVHLPSRSGRMEWGGETRNIRLPDFSRVRLVR